MKKKKKNYHSQEGIQVKIGLVPASTLEAVTRWRNLPAFRRRKIYTTRPSRRRGARTTA